MLSNVEIFWCERLIKKFSSLFTSILKYPSFPFFVQEIKSFFSEIIIFRRLISSFWYIERYIFCSPHLSNFK